MPPLRRKLGAAQHRPAGGSCSQIAGSPTLALARKLAQQSTNYYWGNSHQRFSDIFGRESTFLVSHSVPVIGADPERFKPSASIIVWTHGGQMHAGHVGEWALELGTTPAAIAQRTATFREIVKTAERYGKGEYRCSKCQEWFAFPYAGSYFAGRYCTECWEGGIKQQEARETYN
jgi:hypothetical protein